MNRKKMMVYNLREFDEREYFKKYAEEYELEIISSFETPTLENAYLANGCDYVNIITTPVNENLLKIFKKQGTKYLVTRTIGYDHIDLKAAKNLDIKIAHTPYGPDGVAEYTILLMLMCIRKMKSIRHRFLGQDYTLKGLIGKELSDMTIGVIGTGRIGTRLIKMLSGFGCKVIAYSVHKNLELKGYAEYCSLDTLFKESDLITLHMASTNETEHMIDDNAIDKMKDGVVLVNTARGSLMDTQAVIKGLNTGKISSLGLDVVEDESALFYYDRREDILPNSDLYLLNSYPNVVITHHMAFYTDHAVETMVKDSLKGAYLDMNGKDNPFVVSK